MANYLDLPAWADLGLTHRTRFESIHNQFRTGFAGDDSLLSLQSLISGRAQYNNLSFSLELIDARAYLADSNTPIDTTITDPLDILQAYAATRFQNVLADGDRLGVKIGRMTLDAGNRRLVARPPVRNTFNNFTGIDAEYRTSRDDRLRTFATVPIQRLPEGRDDLIATRLQMDKESFQTFFGGIFVETRNRLNPCVTEFYVLGLYENDSPDWATRDRKIVSPGLRTFIIPETGNFDFEIDVTLQAGTSRATVKISDTTDLQHLAYALHSTFGYSLPTAGRLRPSLEFDYASGDGSATDNVSGRFDPLYGARRFFLGPISLYGAFAFTNISSPGLRLEIRPTGSIRAFVLYRAFWLASPSDVWTTTGLQDKAGRSGSFLGHQVEAEFSYRIFPGNMTLDTGLAYLFPGNFQQNLNAAQGEATYVFVSLTLEI